MGNLGCWYGWQDIARARVLGIDLDGMGPGRSVVLMGLGVCCEWVDCSAMCPLRSRGLHPTWEEHLR